MDKESKYALFRLKESEQKIDELLASGIKDTNVPLPEEIKELSNESANDVLFSYACDLKRRKDALEREIEALKEKMKPLNLELKMNDLYRQSLNAAILSMRDNNFKIKNDRGKLEFKKSVKTVVDHLNLLGEKYVRIKREPDKNAIKNDISMGVDVPGARLEESYTMTVTLSADEKKAAEKRRRDFNK